MAENDADVSINSSKKPDNTSKLKDANTKYMKLLKLAKERIQSQEEEVERLKGKYLFERYQRFYLELLINASVFSYHFIAALKEMEDRSDKVGASVSKKSSDEPACYSYNYDIPLTQIENHDQSGPTVVKVSHRIKIESESNISTTSMIMNQAPFIIWALIEYEYTGVDNAEGIASPKRFTRWRRFYSENDLIDHVRNNTGEPIGLPPYSLSPQQSQRIEEESRQAVAHVTEEFRRFRVRSEVVRKQADATVRSLQNNNVLTAQKQIEGQDIASELAQARSDHEQLVKLRQEMAEQESHWREAYDAILVENNALKSSGSEALLAAQWRQRYETCLTEKEKLETALAIERQKSDRTSEQQRKLDAGKYESKYKDLKESFRLYRKKAKEIFEAQQKGDVAMINLGDSGEEAKISYLRNLMVNYLSSDPTVREHMEGAITTVLKFSKEEKDKIAKQKAVYQTKGAWF